MTPPVIGAALTVETLERLRPWFEEAPRDIEIQDFIWPATLDGASSALTARARAALAGLPGRVGMHGPFWDLRLDATDPEAVATLRRRLGQGLDVCAAIGATQMVAHSPFTAWLGRNLDCWAGARESMIARCVDNLAPVVARAADQGVGIVIENIEDADPRDRLRLARAFDSPAVRVSLDTGHAQCAHVAGGGPPVDHFVTTAGDALAHVHLQDVDGWADRHWPPGEGTVPWRGVFAALGRVGGRPRLVLEMADPADIPRGAAWLVAQGLAV